MWTYNYSDELYHYGVLGMKWGKRRYQNKDGSYTSAGKNRRASKNRAISNRHKPTKIDETVYGKRGAQRIADRRNKGDSRKKAVGKELVRQMLIGVGASTALGVASFEISSGGVLTKTAAKRTANLGKKLVESYFNGQVLDSSGKVIKRYHQTVKFVDDVSSVALVKR